MGRAFDMMVVAVISRALVASRAAGEIGPDGNPAPEVAALWRGSGNASAC
jgi:hypothetical protein